MTIDTHVIAAALPLSATGQDGPDARPTIVLVLGAFADSSSWNGVVKILSDDGYHVLAAANPLRGVAGDAAYVATIVKSVKGPVILVGHSYSGAVISTAAASTGNVKALVYVAAFAPDTGETSLALSGKFPGSTLARALAPPGTWQAVCTTCTSIRPSSRTSSRRMSRPSRRSRWRWPSARSPTWRSPRSRRSRRGS